MNDLRLFDTSFQLKLTAAYHISIQVSLNGYTYSIQNTIRNKLICVKHFNFAKQVTEAELFNEIRKLLKEEAYLNREYKGVSVSYVTPKSVLVPKELFNEDDLKTYFSFTHNLLSEEEILYNKIADGSAYNVFAIPSSITTLLVNHFKNVKFYHHATPLINHAIKEGLSKNGNLQVFTHNDWVTMMLSRDSKVVFYNSFKFKTDQDYVFNILNVFKQFELNPRSAELILSGDINDNSNLVNTLKKYIANILFAKLNKSFKYSTIFDNLPEHYFTNLYNVFECE